MLCNNILDALGNTPLIKLNRLVEPGMADVYVKLESLNVGGSIKTRISAAMVLDAIERGELKPGGTIVEPTSGNQGIGLALVGAALGYKVKIVMPDSVSGERRKLCEAYGAEVVLVEDKGNIGECIEECLNTALAIKAADPENVFVPQQFENKVNPRTHYEQTGREILADAPGTIHGFVSGIGTGGTLTGVGHALLEANPDMEIWAVEPTEAAILAGGTVGTHMQMGIGDGLIPDNLDTDIYHSIVTVTDEAAMRTAQKLACEEGLAVGISSGTNVFAALALARKLGEGKRVVTILPDTSERYFSTPLFDWEQPWSVFAPPAISMPSDDDNDR